jgi:hypothetical protein
VNGFLLIAGLVVLAIVAAYLSYYFKRKRREALALMARQLGMEYSPQDQVGCLNYPFALLAKGEGRGTENVVWGTWQGIPMTEFDYWYYEESTTPRATGAGRTTGSPARSRRSPPSARTSRSIARACSPGWPTISACTTSSSNPTTSTGGST